LQQRLAIEQNVDFRCAGCGMYHAQRGVGFGGVILCRDRCCPEWEKSPHEGQGDEDEGHDPGGAP